MAISNFRNAPTESDEYASKIHLGRIINVNYKTFAVDVSVDSNGATYENVQLGMPYFHYDNGEGIYVIPEVGAQCVIATPSDSNDPFVVCFLALPEATSQGATTEQTTDEVGDTAEENTETEAEEASNESVFQYNNNRPIMRPGDICFRTRDDNFIFLRRGGVVQIGATAISQRMYIPIRNFIKDFAENYQLNLAGGSMSWELVNEDDSHNGVLHRFIWREYAEHANASVMCSVGQLGDNYLEFVMAPEAINPATGEVSGDTKIRIIFTKEGECIRECQKETITVDGDRKIVISGTHEEECKEYKQTVSGNRTVKFKEEKKTGTSSVEDLTTKEIRASTVKLGSGTYSGVLGEVLLSWLGSHSHPGNGAPPTVQPIGILAKNVKLS